MTKQGLLAAALLLGVACDSGDKSSDTETEPTETEATETEATETEATESETDELDGEALYGTHCASCHGADGTGGTERSITGELHHSDEELLNVILNGEGPMPAIDVTEEEAQAIVDWMRATFSG